MELDAHNDKQNKAMTAATEVANVIHPGLGNGMSAASAVLKDF